MPFDTDLTPTPTWDDVPAWDAATPLLGGLATAPLNVQAQALLNRTKWLADNIERQGKSIFSFMSPAEIADVVSGTNAIDLASAFAAARSWAASLGRPAAIIIPEAKYKASEFPNFGISGLSLETIGTPELICTGVGPILNFDGSAGWVYYVKVGSMLLTGNPLCAVGMRDVKVAHGYFDKIRIREIATTGKAFQTMSGVLNVYESPEHSVNSDVGMVSVAAKGMSFESFAGIASTDCIISNAIMEGGPQGIVFEEADFCVTIAGTAEANSVRGVNIFPVCKGIRLINMCCEANTTEDVLDQGQDTVIDGGYFANKINQAGAVRPVVRGVRCQTITADASTIAPTYEDIKYSSFGAGGNITINAAVTKISRRRWVNIETGTYSYWGGRENTGPSSLFANITITASPFTYTNASDNVEQVVVRNSAGTVTRVDAVDTGANLTAVGGVQGLTAPGVYTVMPGEGLKVTYSGATASIEMVRLPR